MTASSPRGKGIAGATLSQYKAVTTAGTNGALIGAGARKLTEASISNLTGATIYVKLYDKATAPTVGTDVPVATIPVAAAAHTTIAFGCKQFLLGFGIAVTGAAAATDTTNTGAGAQISATYQ